jgi:hypothetical protein
VSIGKKTLVATILLLGIAPAAMAVEMPATTVELSPPSASGFAALLVSSSTAYAKAHGDPRRIVRPDCVEPVRGRYMCSYEVRVPGDAAGCHLIQARWTPERASLFTVTLAGRTRSCGSLQEALHSLH